MPAEVTMHGAVQLFCELLGLRISQIQNDERGERTPVRYKRARKFAMHRAVYSEAIRTGLASGVFGEPTKNQETHDSSAIKVFDALYQGFENLIAELQRKLDWHYLNHSNLNLKDTVACTLASLYEITHYSQSGTSTNTAFLFPSTCPLIYIGNIAYGLSIEQKSVAALTMGYLKDLLIKIDFDQSVDSLSITKTIWGLNSKRDTPRSFYSVFQDIETLQSELCSLRKGKESSIKNFIDEFHGIYSCAMLFMRIKKTTKGRVIWKSLLTRLWRYCDLIYRLHPQNGRKVYLIPSNQIERSYKHGRYRRIFSLIWPLHGDTGRTPHTHQHSELTSIMASAYWMGSPESILKAFNSLPSSDLSIGKIGNALTLMIGGKKNKAIGLLREVIVSIDDLPNFLQRLVCTLFVGLSLSEDFSPKKNEYDSLVTRYLARCQPENDIRISGQPQYLSLDLKLDLRLAGGDYDINYGLTRIISSYNKLINNLDEKISNTLVVNPLSSIDNMLNSIFHDLDSSHRKPSRKLIAEITSNKKTLIKKSRVPLYDITLLDIRGSFVFDYFGLKFDLDQEDHPSGKNENIRRYLHSDPQLRRWIRNEVRQVIFDGSGRNPT